MGKRAAIYCRISRDDELDGLGVARQEKLCRAACARRGHEVVKVLTDNNISASGRVPRPGFEELLTLDVDVLMAVDLDRLVRTHKDLLRLSETGREIETESGPISEFEMELRTSFAAEELRKIRKRITRKHEELAQRGMPVGGMRPFGYTNNRREGLVDTEAQAIREIVARFLSGASQAELARWLNDGGITTSTGKPWSQVLVRALLSRSDIAGVRERDGAFYPAVWEPIIDLEQHEAIKVRLALVKGHRSASDYLLSPPAPLAFCGRCGGPLYGGADARRGRQYRCLGRKGGCGKLYALADPLEAHVVRIFREWKLRPEWEHRHLDTSATRSRIDALDSKAEHIKSLAVERVLTAAEARAQLDAIATERAYLLERMGDAAAITGTWEDKSVGEKRTALRQAFEVIRVDPGRVIEERVKFRTRH